MHVFHKREWCLLIEGFLIFWNCCGEFFILMLFCIRFSLTMWEFLNHKTLCSSPRLTELNHFLNGCLVLLKNVFVVSGATFALKILSANFVQLRKHNSNEVSFLCCLYFLIVIYWSLYRSYKFFTRLCTKISYVSSKSREGIHIVTKSIINAIIF